MADRKPGQSEVDSERRHDLQRTFGAVNIQKGHKADKVGKTSEGLGYNYAIRLE